MKIDKQLIKLVQEIEALTKEMIRKSTKLGRRAARSAR